MSSSLCFYRWLYVCIYIFISNSPMPLMSEECSGETIHTSRRAQSSWGEHINSILRSSSTVSRSLRVALIEHQWFRMVRVTIVDHLRFIYSHKFHSFSSSIIFRIFLADFFSYFLSFFLSILLLLSIYYQLKIVIFFKTVFISAHFKRSSGHYPRAL